MDLETLKQVKFAFELHSDKSTKCNGYHSLCRMIEEAESKAMNQWISVSERLPEIPKDAPSHAQRVKVIACWGNEIGNMEEMMFCKRIVRGKEVFRFEWQGRISPWKVTHWMEFQKFCKPNELTLRSSFLKANNNGLFGI